MSREEIIDSFLSSDVINKWHWFYYHFSFYLQGREHPFAKSIVDAIFNIGEKVTGADKDFILKLSSISGKEKDIQHYEQLMQILSEILILDKCVTYEWENLKKFEYEPTTINSKKNPELNIITQDHIIGLEVKSPSIVEHANSRTNKHYQMLARHKVVLDILPKESTTLPKDNPVKDFLLSADHKFSSFKEKYPNYISILYIIWDDYINEPISAILTKPHGLFMEDSFAKDKNGNTLKFQNVDFVILSRHRYQLHCMAGEKPFMDQVDHPLDYGQIDRFPYKVIIRNPNNNAVLTEDIVNCFQVQLPSELLGAEYCPSDVISWL